MHARAAAKFVELVDKFDVKVVVKKDSLEASGDSIMGLLMLGASKGSEIDWFCLESNQRIHSKLYQI